MTNQKDKLEIAAAQMILDMAAKKPREALESIVRIIKENKELKRKLQELNETLIRREG